jgi:hypothetical protein
MTHEGFSTQHRMLARISCWGTLIVGLAYTVFAVLSNMYDPPTAHAVIDPFGDPFGPIASLLLIPTSALMIASMAAVHAYAPAEAKAYSLSSLVFMSFAMGITSLINFAFFFILTHPLEFANAPWLSFFFPSQGPSMVGELDYVAWSWFFGLSMILAAFVFKEGKLEKTLRILMLATGIFPIVGWLMMIFLPSARLPALLMQALGWGVLIFVVWFLLARLFDRIPLAEQRGV